MYEPVGVVCHLMVDGVETEFAVTSRVINDRVMQALRRLVKDNKREEIRQATTILAEVRKEMMHAPGDYALLQQKTMEQLSQKIIDAGRATEEEALDAITSREGCALALHLGVEGAPSLEKCREIFGVDANRMLFIEAASAAKEEEQEALKNSSRRNPPAEKTASAA